MMSTNASKIRSFASSLAMCVLAAPQLHATSIIVRLEKDRILVATDNRAGMTSRSAFGSSSSTVDNACKIHLFGGTAVAVAGTISNSESRSHQGWDAFSDAQMAYQLKGENTAEFAKTWDKLSADHVAAYALSNPNFVNDFGIKSGATIMYGAYFLRWIFGSPVVLLEWVAPEANRIQTYEYVVPPALGAEMSTNAKTEELIKGETPRAQAVARKWKLLSRQYPQSDVSWRHLEFLIRETSKLDTDVSPSADVLEITTSDKFIWLHKSACH